ncbi:Hypothetical protein GOX0488 [Gluconobacter oxydans 621H]|uniref:Uncharacterized protein n=1 Tax=Gluconobacter oxydans (strain 621H) TaxID=290633 RepID=Q5FTM9_GLUOX|nr:Hypothetical protein GOX0488 [Gluconobacter oxydans 621H]
MFIRIQDMSLLDIICHVSPCARNLSGQKQEMLFGNRFCDDLKFFEVVFLFDLKILLLTLRNIQTSSETLTWTEQITRTPSQS